ncbi:MAG TPA: PEPxxWA-CTERM sorting domain-containing protein [Phenylobacterium sp.]|nr:PEPxxWA-CTERM sorting domain-containing protein [Phenylobacterium sp.]
MKNGLVGFGAALFLLLWTTPASAVVIRIAATGSVNWGLDVTGVFGTPNQSLSNDPFTFVATLDLSKASYSSYGGFRTDLYGGDLYQTPSLGGGVLTINGHSQAIHGQWHSSLLAMFHDDYNFDQQAMQDHLDDGVRYFSNAILFQQSPSYGLFDPLSYELSSGNRCLVKSCIGNFQFYDSLNGDVISSAYGDFSITSLTISAVPEPSTWAVMVLGFCGVGQVLRGRRRQLAPV